MRSRTIMIAVLVLLALRSESAFQEDAGWRKAFAVSAAELGPTGRNRFLVLEPGYALTLERGTERLVITVLPETRRVDGVVTRVVEERETKDGQLVEISRNFFAISKRTRDVYYFGEEVDIYKNGKIVAHEGAWESGKRGARFGLMIPGTPRIGDRFYQEVAPRVAMDRAKIVSLNASVVTPAGRFTKCLKVEETTPLEPDAREFKVYAPGIGLVQDGELRLVKSGKK